MVKKIFESTLIMGMSSVLVMALDLVRVKILAVILGPSGVGTLSLLNHFHTVVASVVGLGLGVGLVKYVATYAKEENTEAVEAVLSNAFKIVLIFAFCLGCTSVLLSSYLSFWILGDRQFNIFIIIYAVSLPLVVYTMIAGSFLQGLKRIKVLAKINILRSSITLFIIVPLIILFSLKGAVLSVLIGAIVHLILIAFYVKKERNYRHFTPWQKIDPKILKKLFGYGVASLTVGVAFYLSHLLLKIIIVQNLGLEMNGIYQPIWALTMSYPTLVLSSMSAYSLPKLCELSSTNDINEELNGILRVAILLILPVMFILIIARNPIIRILYNSEFVEAAKFMPIQILGDYFKVLCWSLGMYLLPTKRLKTFVWLNLLQDIVLVVLAAVFIKQFKLYGITTAFSLSYIVAFSGYYVCARRQISFVLWSKNRGLLIASLIALLAIILSEKFLHIGYHAVVVSVAVFLWALFSIKKEELLMFKDYMVGKMKKMQIVSSNR